MLPELPSEILYNIVSYIDESNTLMSFGLTASRLHKLVLKHYNITRIGLAPLAMLCQPRRYSLHDLPLEILIKIFKDVDSKSMARLAERSPGHRYIGYLLKVRERRDDFLRRKLSLALAGMQKAHDLIENRQLSTGATLLQR
ncbi:hypothetical protein H2200_000439 [Cladophialophora chaetospira]|uniref:F-box domain-containing protein n=1 Tax=Cladophialophora chaetospira TaxID=386627 RepID=A0AA39CQC2_9EURO|nr:hypothetical protein H2200_000439 [Cladophialophora chaetospira]